MKERLQPNIWFFLLLTSYFSLCVVDWETDRFRLNENDDNNSKTNQNDTIDSTDAESNTDAIADFDNVRLRQMLRKLEKMIGSLAGTKRQDKRSIAHGIKNMLTDIKHMIHTWVSDGTEIRTEDESSSANDGDDENREIGLRTHAKLRNWVKKLKNITYFMDSDTSDSDTDSSSDSDDDADSPYECTYLPGKRARRS